VPPYPHLELSFFGSELCSCLVSEFLAFRRCCYASRKLRSPTQEHQLVLDSREHAKLLCEIQIPVAHLCSRTSRIQVANCSPAMQKPCDRERQNSLFSLISFLKYE